jgi:hypothetical protein
LLALQLAAFKQATLLRDTRKKLSQKLWRWLPLEGAIILTLVIGATSLPKILVGAQSRVLVAALLTWSVTPALLFYIRQTYEPGLIETGESRASTIFISRYRQHALSNKLGLTGALIWRDLQFLWRSKRSVFAWLLFAVAIATLACLAQESAEEAYAGSIVLEIIFGLFPNTKYCGLLLNISLGLMILFWFYMPFGTLLLLAISALWIHKSQRHFQFT